MGTPSGPSLLLFRISGLGGHLEGIVKQKTQSPKDLNPKQSGRSSEARSLKLRRLWSSSTVPQFWPTRFVAFILQLGFRV